MESDVVGQLFSTTGAGGRDREEGWRSKKVGVPTVADRIAQMVVKMYLEPFLEPYFHPDSYAYRPNKSAIQAAGVARERCWHYDWVLDLDIKGFYDNIDHDLLMRAVRKHTDCKWILLYIERWLKAPAQLEDGSLINRDKGTPQGSVISPLLANLFLHYAFDEWMRRNHPHILFERYADDIIVHCKSERQAKWTKTVIEGRLLECKLEPHPEKTKIVYCKDDYRRGNYVNEKFDFLGYTFRPRGAKARHKKRFFVGFNPALSNKAAKSMGDTIRGWKIHLMSDKSIEEISRIINPVVRGWSNYYGQYYRSALYPIFNQLNNALRRWAMRKYKRLRGRNRKATLWLRRIAHRDRGLFAHWNFSTGSLAGR